MATIEVDGENPAAGLLALVVTVLDILLEALEREAVRRMETEQLSDEQIERMGAQLLAIESELDRLIEEEDIEEDVRRLRGDLDGILRDAFETVSEDAPIATAGDRP